MMSTMPAGPSLAGIAAVRARAPLARSGATKHDTARRERPHMASTAVVAAAASAYGAAGHKAVIRAASLRRDGSSTRRVNARPATVASAQGITVFAGGTPSTDKAMSRGDPFTDSATSA